MAARLATHIRGVEVFEGDDVKRLKVVAATLDIRGPMLPNVLSVLQEADMVRVRLDVSGELQRIQESIPTYGDLYQRIGEVHESHATTEVEDSLLQSFHTVVSGPIRSEGKLPVELLNQDTRVQLEAVADQAGILSSTVSKQGGKIYYSPQYWDENALRVADVVERYGDERVREIVASVTATPGLTLPMAGEQTITEKIFSELAQLGVLPAPTVTSWKGERAFAFTPFHSSLGDPILNSKKMEKTRAILSCVRYGQNFGTITSVRDPIQLLGALQDRDKIGPHSEIPDQYQTLLQLGLARLSASKQYPGRYYLHFIKNEENLEALETAMNLLQHGSPIQVNKSVKNYARMQGDYCVPVRARAAKKYAPGPDELRAFRRDMIEIALL
jgi:hypothetical protein